MGGSGHAQDQKDDTGWGVAGAVGKSHIATFQTAAQTPIQGNNVDSNNESAISGRPTLNREIPFVRKAKEIRHYFCKNLISRIPKILRKKTPNSR